jgi:PadR family transcriptional regulator AphA
MTANTATFRYFILGLLSQKPMSGYDIKRFLESLSWLIGSPSFGGLYPALHALHKDGLVTVDLQLRDGKPPRKIYGPTESGRRALKEWIGQPANSSAPLKGFLMRLILADSYPPAGLIAHLQQRRAQVAASQVDLQKTAESPEKTNLGQRLALEYGVALAASELAWLDSVLNRLSELLPMEVVQGDSVISTA